MSAAPSDTIPAIRDLGALLAHAYAIEIDAMERYRMLADQMEVHNNHELAALFARLAGHEERHAEEILKHAGEDGLPAISESAMAWPDAESPETAELDEAHYRMTPWHALQMALRAERRAFAFFDHLAATASDPQVKTWAGEFRDEEAGHVKLVEQLLERHHEPKAGWDADDDPPSRQD